MSESKEPPKPPIDLSAIGLLPALRLEALGDVRIDIFATSFEQLVDDWAEAPKGDAVAFVRALLQSHAQTADDPPGPLAEDALATVTDEQLERAAEAILDAAAWRFRPKYVGEGVGTRRKVRRRSEAEAHDLSPREGEGAAARLLRLLTAWRQDRRDLDWKINVSARLVATGYARAFAESPFQRLIEQQKSTSRLLAADLASAPLRNSPLLTAISQMGSGLAGAQRSEANRLVQLLKDAALPRGSALGLYPDIAARFERPTVANALVDAVKRDAFSGIAAMVREREVGWGRELQWLTAANRTFDLKLPGATLAAIAALHQPIAELGATRLSPFPTGFQIAAELGLSGIVAQGAVADLLRHYSEELPEDAPVFSGTVETALLIDAVPDTPEHVVAHLERFVAMVVALARQEGDILRKGGIIGLVLLACTLYGTWKDVTDDAATQTQVEALSGRVGALQGEVSALRKDLAEERQRAADNDRFTRYVHQRAPLRAEPHAKSLLLRHIYPEQPVRVRDERGDWVYVEVYDYHGGGLVSGWMARSWLRLKAKD